MAYLFKYKLKMENTGGSSGKKKYTKGQTASFGGKKYKYLGDGKWEGMNKGNPKYKNQGTTSKTNYKSTGSKKGKPRY